MPVRPLSLVEPEKGEPAPLARPGRRDTQHPKFPQVRIDPGHLLRPPIPRESQQNWLEISDWIARGDLKAAEEASREFCESFGNYRLPTSPEEGEPFGNTLTIVWEGCYSWLAQRYRREGMPEKAIPLERELIKWGSSWSPPRWAARRLQKGLKLRGSLYIPPGPHEPDATVYATVTLLNDNATTIRTQLDLRTAKGFDKAYRPDKGKWVRISHPGSHLFSSPTYDITIPARSTWKRAILVTAHSLEHVGSYELRIHTNCIDSRANTALLQYVGSVESSVENKSH